MPRDSLRALVERGDRERAVPSRIEPDRLILAARPPSNSRQICLDCRRDPFEVEWAAFMERYTAASKDERCEMDMPRRKDTDVCSLCGGLLVEVTV